MAELSFWQFQNQLWEYSYLKFQKGPLSISEIQITHFSKTEQNYKTLRLVARNLTQGAHLMRTRTKLKPFLLLLRC